MDRLSFQARLRAIARFCSSSFFVPNPRILAGPLRQTVVHVGRRLLHPLALALTLALAHVPIAVIVRRFDSATPVSSSSSSSSSPPFAFEFAMSSAQPTELVIEQTYIPTAAQPQHRSAQGDKLSVHYVRPSLLFHSSSHRSGAPTAMG